MNKSPQSLIKVLPEFDRLVQPLTPEELNNLSKEIFDYSELRTIRTWNGYHLTDQSRFELCGSLQLSVEIQSLMFDDQNEAAIYICKDQLRNPYICSEQKKYIIGQYLEYQIKKNKKKNSSSLKYTSANDIAHELYISAGTVLKYNLYSAAMNTVFSADSTFARDILMGKVKVSHENVIELSRLKKDEIKSVAKAIRKDSVEHVTFSYIRNEVKWSYVQSAGETSRRVKAERQAFPSPAIRQMPEYNPDAEVNSLCMTIDSWISSIQRVSSSENFDKITSKAGMQLIKKLTYLEHVINAVQDSLVERTNI